MGDFTEYLRLCEANERVATLYHVTPLRNLAGIAAERYLIPNRTPNWSKAGWWDDNSKRGVFFTADPQHVKDWVRTYASRGAGATMFDNRNRPLPQDMIPVILRFRMNMNKQGLERDVGSDSRYDMIIPRSIPVQGLEMWTGREWTRSVNPSLLDVGQFIDHSGFHDIRRYPFPPLGYVSDIQPSRTTPQDLDPHRQHLIDYDRKRHYAQYRRFPPNFNRQTKDFDPSYYKPDPYANRPDVNPAWM